MKPLIDYITLAILFVPPAATLAVLTKIAITQVRERRGNTRRNPSWLSQGRTAATQFRL